ncbi:hypothetical protein HPB51_011753 [Rhipicephalus microplus]|uniref:Uncharacterized protein n=1 Tax=Rhipicephalus microplus TaxID=6941 RepID=A0A9J6DMS0_RHIMP|nr:hypothetical protein HPB51_011753 [Rhipicephalus microplus]
MVVARSDGAAAAGMDTPDDPVLLAKQSDWNKASQLFHLDSIRVKLPSREQTQLSSCACLPGSGGAEATDAPICASRRRVALLCNALLDKGSRRHSQQCRGGGGCRRLCFYRYPPPPPRLFYERVDLGASAAAPPALIGAETALANGEPKVRL